MASRRGWRSQRGRLCSGEPNRYEIQSVWGSGELASFDRQVSVPPVFVQAGHTYRIRVKHQGNTGRWSHWSAPVQFAAGTAGVDSIARSLIVSELFNRLATNVNRRDSGAYSVVATNVFGAALSQPASLRVLVPQRLESPGLQPGSGLHILSQDADGGLLGDTELNGFFAETSTNLVNWEEMPGALMITNGQLLLHEPDATNHPLRFYRIFER